MSEFASTSTLKEMTVEEQSLPENIDDQHVPSRDEVFCNDHLFLEILSYIHKPSDRVRAERVAKRWHLFVNGYDAQNTLYIVRETLGVDSLVKVSYDNPSQKSKICLYLKIHSDYLRYDEIVKIMTRLSKEAINGIQRIVVRGFRSNAHSLHRDCTLHLHVDWWFGVFLDQFLNLRHLEMELVHCDESFLNGIKNFKFPNQLKIIFLPLTPHFSDMMKIEGLIGKKVEVLHMFELSLWFLVVPEPFDCMLKQSIKIVIHKETNKESMYRHGNGDYHIYKDAIRCFRKQNKYFEIPYHNLFCKYVHLDRQIVPSFRNCHDLARFYLFRLEERGDENVIMRTILEIRNFTKLTILVVDGHFNKNHLRKLLVALKQCRMLSHLHLRMRNVAKKDWLYFIRRLPKHIEDITLDGYCTDEAIAALSPRLTKSLKHLRVFNRKTRKNVSIRSFK